MALMMVVMVVMTMGGLGMAYGGVAMLSGDFQLYGDVAYT